MLTKTAYIDGKTLQLDLWGYQFHVLEDRVAWSTRPEREELVDRIGTLKRKRRQLKRRLTRAACETGRDWERTRGKLEVAVRDFRQLAGDVYNEIRRTGS